MKNLDHFYNILELNNKATTKEIKNSYRRLSLKYHPDKNPKEKDGLKFKEITEAYKILRSNEKKSYQNVTEDIGTKYADFWNFQSKEAQKNNEFYKYNFNPFNNGFDFGSNFQSNSPNQEKPISQKSTHIILYLGLGAIALWIIFSDFFKF